MILPAGQMKRLNIDVALFYGAEQEYARQCIPWHRGWLLEGPPGQRGPAIASHFEMDVWHLR